LNIKIKDAIIAPFPDPRGRHYASSAAPSCFFAAAPPIRPDFPVLHALYRAVRLRFTLSHE